ncbi:hypothetical protein EJA01_09195 [Rhodovulum iodosum]|nr:hypothetical protein EJA01_09195 [Rhodovulum robiginosum]
MTPVVQACAVAAIAFGTGAATLSAMKDDLADLAVPSVTWEPGAALDGRVFYTEDTIEETGEVMHDELRFVNGRFQSSRCQLYCDFGWSDYKTWAEGDVIHFTTTTYCPDAPHTVVWYGKVTGDQMRFDGTWTTRRWYWTRQLNVAGQGSVTPHDSVASSG